MVTEQIAVTLLVIDALEAMQVPYVVGGSLASTLYGFARTTADSDLVADLRSQHIAPFAHRLQSAFYLDESAIRDAISRRASFNVIHLATMLKVDVFIPKGRRFDKVQFINSRLQVVSTDPYRSIYFASPEDTILAKLEWFRKGGEISERQWRDVLGIIAVQAERLDWDYLYRGAAELGVADLVAKLKSHQG